MSQLLLNKWRKLAGIAAMLVAFVVIGTVDASAQQRANVAGDTPESNLLAAKIGVTPCPIGTATNIQGGLASIDAQRTTLRALINSGSATALDRYKYFYFESISNQVGRLSVAPEVALLESVRNAVRESGADNISQQQMIALYNSTKALFGMC